MRRATFESAKPSRLCQDAQVAEFIQTQEFGLAGEGGEKQVWEAVKEASVVGEMIGPGFGHRPLKFAALSFDIGGDELLLNLLLKMLC